MHTPFLAKGILVDVWPLFMCFSGDSILTPEICFLQFCLSFQSFSLPSLNIVLDDSYNLKLCRFMNCSAPELHFSTRFLGASRRAAGLLLALLWFSVAG